MDVTSPTEVEFSVMGSSKKQRSARSSGKKGWTPAVPEIRRLVGCSYSTNDGFFPHMLVWAKLDGGPWWPARVVDVDEIPEDLKKQEEGLTCVKYYGVENTKSFAWLKAEDALTFEKHFKEFSQQSIPSDFSGGSFNAALTEIQEMTDGNNAKTTSKASSGTIKHQENKVLQAYSSPHGRVVKESAHLGDDIDQPFKRRKLKFKGVESVTGTDDDLSTNSKGKEPLKEVKGQDRIMETKSKRKRIARQQTESDGTATGGSLELAGKKVGSTTVNSSSLSSHDHLKKSRGKKTGADGYYFECMVCDIGGNLLCCDLCPRVYHLGCLNPPLKRTPPGKWICPVCRDTPGALKAVGTQILDFKPRSRLNSNESEATAVVPAPTTKSVPKRGWKVCHTAKQLTPDLDLRELRKRRREDDTERPRKKVNLKLNSPLGSLTQPKCKQCGVSMSSSGESPSNVFCEECVVLMKKGHVHPTERMVLPRNDVLPTRYSKLKAGKCDICSKPGLVIICDVCPRGFHKDCLNPPRKRAPKGAWLCPKCGPAKEMKERKEVKEVQERRDDAKEVKGGKVVKAAKVVKDTEQCQSGEEEQTSANPSPLEVDRILGCRIPFNSPSSGKPVGSVCIPSDRKRLSVLEDQSKSKAGSYTPGARSEEGKNIEIRLPICEADHIVKDSYANVGPNDAPSASGISTAIGAGPESVSSAECRSINPLLVVRDDTIGYLALRTKSRDLDSGIENDASLQWEKAPGATGTQLGFKILERVTSDEKGHESRMIKDDLQTSSSGAAVSEEDSESAANFSRMAKTSSNGRDTTYTEMVGANSNTFQLQAQLSDMEEGGDLKDRSSPDLMSIANVVSISDEIQPPVNSELCGKAVEDSLLTTKDIAGVSAKDVLLKSLDPILPHPELEFLVKWAGRAHIHNEWVREDYLRSAAKRKLENFKLKHGNAPKMLVEDKWVKPQRVVAKRSVLGKCVEVLVKWSGLSYEECTWERVDHPVIVSNAELLTVFERFEQEAPSLDTEFVDEDADSVERSRRGRCVTDIKEQPTYLKGGSLFPHQMEALNWLRKCWHRRRSVILADEMGLGKTISACSFIASLYHEFKVRAPCLVLVPLSTMPNWLAEFALWAPSLNVIEYHGSAKARALIREYEWHVQAGEGTIKKLDRTFKFNVILTTYEMVIADSSQLRAVPWEVLVVDEGHRLKNSSSKLFTLLNTFSFFHRVLLTGTPLQNNFGEMFNLLNFLQPDIFPSLAAFQDKFSSLSTADQVEELKKLVAPNMLRRLKKDAMQKIPPKTELVVPVDMTSVQVEYYKALLTRNYQVLRTGGKQQSMLNIVMQLRKVCNHPYLIAGTEPDSGTAEFLQEMRIKASAKLMLLHSMLGKLKAAGHRVLIFSQMTKLLDILEDYLSFEFGQDAFERVDGSVSVAERQTAIGRFNQDISRFVFLLSTRACGLGINLATADTVIIYDSDFNPQADIQAMNRAHRIGQSKTLLVYRLVVRASVEERILQLAKKKLMLDHLFANKTGSQKEIDDILRWGTEELFQETPILPDEPSSGTGTSVTGDDGEVKHRKRGCELEDMYGGYYLQLGRFKVVWDDAAVNRLLDRSDLNSCHPAVAQGEQESDILGSLKAWDPNEQDPVPDCGVQPIDKESKLEKLPTPLPEENQWDKLLRSRWETLQMDEKAALGRGKRNRKVVSYMESNGQKSKELLSEVSDVEKEDGLERDYTPVGRGLKLKLARLRARQKDRILQRYSNEPVRSLGGEKLATASGMHWEGIGALRKLNSMAERPPAPRLMPMYLPSERVSADEYPQDKLINNVPSPASSQKLGNVSVGIEHQALRRRSSSPSFPGPSAESHRGIKLPDIARFVAGTGQCMPIDADGDNFKSSGKSHGQAMWVGGTAPAMESSSIMAHLFGKRVIDVSTISLSTVSQGLESGQSLSQLLPALRQSIQGVQHGTSFQSLALAQPDLRVPIAAAVEGVSNDTFSMDDAGLDVFPRSASRTESTFNIEAMEPVAEHQYKSKAPDITLEFPERIFGGEKNFSTGDTLSTGKDISGQQSKQGLVIPSTILSQDYSSLKLQRSDTSGLGVPLQPTTQDAEVPNLSMALGLQLVDLNPNDDVRDGPTSTVVPSSTSTSLRGSFKTVDSQAVGGIAHTSSPSRKQGTKDVMPIELNDFEPEPIISTRHFLSPGVMEGAMGRNWHTDDQRACREQSSRVWSEDELDALWTGVRRHSVGNWAAMLLDSKLCFLKSRSVGELAHRWKEEQMKMFGTPERLSEAGRKPQKSWAGANAMSGMESDPERGLSDTLGIDQRSSHAGGTEIGLSGNGKPDQGRPSYTRVLLASNDTTESDVVLSDDRLFSRYKEKKDSLPWVPDLEINFPRKRNHYRGTSKPGVPSTFSGLQFLNKIGDVGRLEPTQHGCNYRSLLDLHSSRSSPSIPTSIPGSCPAAGAVLGTTAGSFGLSPEGRFKDNLFRTSGTVADHVIADFGTTLSPRFGLGSDRRRQEAREKTIWHQQQPSFSVTDTGNQLSILQEQSGVSQCEVSLAPCPRLGSPLGHSLGNKALVSLPFNGGPIATTENRRRARGGPSVKAMSLVNADKSTPSNLPHWLREAVKARSTPPQAPLPPAIAAIVQATTILYKNSPRLLPPLVHAGFPLVLPREFPKKVRRQQHQKFSQQQLSISTERVTVGNPPSIVDDSFPIKMEGFNQSLAPLPKFDSLGAGDSSLLSSKGFPDCPLTSGLDPSKQQLASHIPANSSSELMATTRNIMELGLMAGHHPSVVTALNLDDPNTQSSSIADRQQQGPDLGRVLKVRQSLPSSLLAPSGFLDPSASLPSERHFSRNSLGVILSQASQVGRMGEGSLSDPEKKLQLPGWLLTRDAAAIAGDGDQEHQPKVDLDDDDNESTSSKTVSDPGVRRKCGRRNENNDDASSEETISDDGTE